jgi:hypothetical protein
MPINRLPSFNPNSPIYSKLKQDLKVDPSFSGNPSQENVSRTKKLIDHESFFASYNFIPKNNV